MYEKLGTANLRSLLNKYENFVEKIEILMEKSKANESIMKVKEASVILSEMKKISNNYEIDIHLIRMELDRRLLAGYEI